MSRISFVSRLSTRSFVAGLVAAALAACGGSTEPKKDVTPATITAASTDTLRGQVGTQLNQTLTVTVKNAAGQAIDSAVVTFAVASGGGTLSATSVRTDTLGRASTTWTLGNSTGVQTVTATAGALAPVTFVAVGSAQAAATVTKVAGDAQTAVAGATVTTRPSVKVVDKFGNPVANQLVTFAVASGGGAVTGASANTDATGVATVGSWRLGNTAGANSLTATVQGLTPLTFTATGTAGAVAQLRLTNTAPTLISGQTFKFTVQALDANNNVVANPTVAFTSSNTAVATVDASGTVTGAAAGTTTITATSGTGTASQAVSVLGHPERNIVGSVVMSGVIRNIAVTKDVAYAALSSAGAVAAVNLATGTSAFSLVLNVPVLDVAVNGANTLVTAIGGGTTPQFYYINPATPAVTDSVALAVTPARMVMNAAGTRALVDENNFSMQVIDVVGKTVIGNVSLPGTINVMKVAPGDTLAYAGAALGVIYEINMATGAIKRSFQTGTTVTDLTISPDGKTLFYLDGTTNATMIPLATGGLSGQVLFGANPPAGLAITPDGAQLWATIINQISVAGQTGGTFDTSAGSRVTLANTNLMKLAFTRLGDFAVVLDLGANALVVLK